MVQHRYNIGTTTVQNVLQLYKCTIYKVLFIIELYILNYKANIEKISMALTSFLNRGMHRVTPLPPCVKCCVPLFFFISACYGSGTSEGLRPPLAGATFYHVAENLQKNTAKVLNININIKPVRTKTQYYGDKN